MTLPTVLPDRIYKVNNIIAQAIIDYLGSPQVLGIIDDSVSEYINEKVVITNGHDDSVAWLPNIVVESNTETHHRVATDWITQTHTFNILCQARRTQNAPAERVIRSFAAAVQQVMYRLISFPITIEDGTQCMVWDIEGDSTIQYGYRTARQVRVALISWACKVDVPLHLLYQTSDES